ncbi:hypothetical protein [Streptomyces hokutonensis]|uniref:hypothetical protein n=1 Tax=Streptomyces hokutonensis TaxID=1306990 RepID=UPI00367E1432
MLSGRARAGSFTRLAPPVLALAVPAAVAGHPELPERRTVAGGLVADGHDGFDAAAAEQLRQDQYLLTSALRLGGPAMSGTAQDGLNRTPDKLPVT